MIEPSHIETMVLLVHAGLVDTIPKEQILGEEDRKKLLRDDETKDKENDGVVGIE